MTHPISGTGDKCFQLPVPLLAASTTRPLDGTAWRVLAFLLWEAHRTERWPRAGEEPVSIRVRYCMASIRAGAGLEAAKDYGALRRALAALARTSFLIGHEDGVVECPIILDPEERPGSHVDLTLSGGLMAVHARPLGHYALLNILQIRDLTKPLDVVLYARACQVARQRMPVFELPLAVVAETVGVASSDWRALRRPFLGACRRVAARTGAQFRLQGWCSGDTDGGIDVVRLQVQAGTKRAWRPFRPKHCAILLEIDGTGHRPFAPASGGIMDIFLGASTTAEFPRST